MKDFKGRLRNVEEKAGLDVRRSYIFIHIIHPESYMSKEALKGKAICQKDDFKGMVVICEEKKGNFRGIDSDSEEGKKILLEHGYKEVREREGNVGC